MKPVIITLSAIVTVLATATGFPCTTFVLKGDGKIYVGRNLDWQWEDGLIIANPRGLKKTALVDRGHPAAQWTSKYGNLTFNQFGLEGPFGGMNEAGLVVEEMTLMESRYPTPDSRPEIDMLEWIQYQLDTCSNVTEVIATDLSIRQPEPTGAVRRIHYLVCDASGDCATIEFLRGKMVVHRGQELPYSALANNSYAESVAYARTNPLPKGFSEHVRNGASLSRFACAASRAAEFKPGTPGEDIACAFEMLEQVSLGKGTVWQVVYDIPARQIHYRIASSLQRRTLSLSSFDLDRARTVRFADIRTSPSAAGNLDFAELTEARHRKYLEAFFGQESFKKALGDFTPQIDSILANLRTYTFVEPQ